MKVSKVELFVIISNMIEQTRSEKPGWSVVASGDNGIDLLHFVIKVDNFNEAAQLSVRVAGLIMQYERPDDVFNTQVTLRDWRVEVQLALPKGTWGTLAQQELTDTLVTFSN